MSDELQRLATGNVCTIGCWRRASLGMISHRHRHLPRCMRERRVQRAQARHFRLLLGPPCVVIRIPQDFSRESRLVFYRIRIGISEIRIHFRIRMSVRACGFRAV